MRVTPPSSDTIEIAEKSLLMSKETGGDRMFRMMAIGMMFVTGIATAFHALHSVYRDVRGRRESRDRDLSDRRGYPSRGEPQYNSTANRDAEWQHEESAPGRRLARPEAPPGRWQESEEKRENARGRSGGTMGR